VLADYDGKDLWNRWVLSLEWNSEYEMEGESGEQVGGELESVTCLKWAFLILRHVCVCVFVCVLNYLQCLDGDKHSIDWLLGIAMDGRRVQQCVVIINCSQ